MSQSQEEKTEEFLSHYGVLGMKWGKTRARGDSMDIKLARGNLQEKAVKADKEIRALYNTAKTGKTAVDKIAVNQIKRDLYNDPDRVLASRLTRGEKAVAIAMGAITAGGYPVAVIGGTSAASRTIERRQETGYYDRKFK